MRTSAKAISLWVSSLLLKRDVNSRKVLNSTGIWMLSRFSFCRRYRSQTHYFLMKILKENLRKVRMNDMQKASRMIFRKLMVKSYYEKLHRFQNLSIKMNILFPSLTFIFIYLKGRVIKRQEDREIFHLFVYSPMAATEGLAKSQELLLGLPHGYRSPSTAAICCYFPCTLLGT